MPGLRESGWNLCFSAHCKRGNAILHQTQRQKSQPWWSQTKRVVQYLRSKLKKAPLNSPGAWTSSRCRWFRSNPALESGACPTPERRRPSILPSRNLLWTSGWDWTGPPRRDKTACLPIRTWGICARLCHGFYNRGLEYYAEHMQSFPRKDLRTRFMFSFPLIPPAS